MSALLKIKDKLNELRSLQCYMISVQVKKASRKHSENTYISGQVVVERPFYINGYT